MPGQPRGLSSTCSTVKPLSRRHSKSLHGFDLTRDDPERKELMFYGGTGPFVHSDADIAEGLARWRRSCAEFDADPRKFRTRRIAEARKWLAENGEDDRSF